MATFKDAEGREWSVRITTGGLTAVREATGVKIGDLLGSQLAGFKALVSDIEQLVNVVWVLVRSQHPGVTDEQFGAALGGDAVEDLASAFYQAVVDFSPRQSRRPLLAVMTKAAEVEAKAAELMMRKVAAIDPEKMLSHPTSSGSAGSSPESPASTPAG